MTMVLQSRESKACNAGAQCIEAAHLRQGALEKESIGTPIDIVKGI